jgi:hypothetical protein
VWDPQGGECFGFFFFAGSVVTGAGALVSAVLRNDTLYDPNSCTPATAHTRTAQGGLGDPLCGRAAASGCTPPPTHTHSDTSPRVRQRVR